MASASSPPNRRAARGVATHQHGGPPAALLVRAMERLAGDGGPPGADDLRLPPSGPDRPADGARRGDARGCDRSADCRATLSTAEGTVVAPGLGPRPAHRTGPAGVDRRRRCRARDPPESAAPFQFPFFRDPIAYHTSVETRLVRGTWGKGPVTAWMRPRVALVEGETRVAAATSARRGRFGERAGRRARSRTGTPSSTPTSPSPSIVSRGRLGGDRCRHGRRGPRRRPDPGAPLGCAGHHRRLAAELSRRTRARGDAERHVDHDTATGYF